MVNAEELQHQHRYPDVQSEQFNNLTVAVKDLHSLVLQELTKHPTEIARDELLQHLYVHQELFNNLMEVVRSLQLQPQLVLRDHSQGPTENAEDQLCAPLELPSSPMEVARDPQVLHPVLLTLT
ncbi:unnamed protein product [Acanthoscelides obtectus]|uniref:Uncharacterized protein n=1 Tax=Acanthoscelides obtectus TaxID=200917 RepID=A0A9P0L3S5_ACAOB|nr:unnamed protein product [Acanthoscelides obtectus]CAK1666441.1 hypothetical protein AOBTE_LOCUS25332 [Acanthoscelides obtectus]